jgi:hypothetical protein
MARTLIGDVSNGKGSRKRIGANDKAYAEGWARIFGKKDKEETVEDCSETKESDTEDKKEGA